MNKQKDDGTRKVEHLVGIASGFQEEQNPTKGQWVHVGGWARGCVFEFQEWDGDVAVLKTPKTRKTYRTCNTLYRTRKHSNVTNEPRGNQA